MSFKIRLSARREGVKPRFTLFDRFTSLAFRTFPAQAIRLSNSMPLLRDNIMKSNLRITPEGLIAVSIFSTAITGLAALVGIYIGYGIFHIPYFLALLAAVPVVFILFVNAPKLSASNRGAAVETELPFVIGYISVLAGGGVSPIATLRRIADLSLFPAAAKEAKRILLQVDVFGTDPITAIETMARWNPNKKFSEFLYGYTAVLKSGGNFIAYVQSKLRDTIEAKASMVKRSADITGTLAESYLTVTVILGMVLYTLYMVQTLISANPNGLTNLYLFAFVIVPLISVAFLWLIDAVQPKWPFVDYRPYKYFAYTVIPALVFFAIPLPIPLFLHTAVTLIAAFSLPAFKAYGFGRERRAMEGALPEFIRDVAEGRKTGLSPEVAIERLHDRHYGALSKHVQKMGAQLSWGVALSKVITTFTQAIGSWITRAVGTLLIEVVDVGGGTIRSFSEMSEFTRQINEMEKDRRSALRPFVFITYIAGVMVIVTTFIMVYLLAQPGAAGLGVSTTPNPHTIDLLFTTAVFDSFVIGIVAGKMGESGVTDGFKHAIALVAVSLVAIYTVSAFLHIPI